jgi:hypothetical protein
VLHCGTGRCQGIEAAFEQIDVRRHLRGEAGLFVVGGEHQMCHVVQGITQSDAGIGIRHVAKHMLGAVVRGQRWLPSTESDYGAPTVGEMLDNAPTDHTQRANDQGSCAVLVQPVWQSAAHVGLRCFNWTTTCGHGVGGTRLPTR